VCSILAALMALYIGLLFEKLGNFFYILVTLHIAVAFVLGMGLAS